MIRASEIDHSYSCSSEVLCLALPSTPQSAANSAAAADVEYWLQPRVVLRADERRVGAGFGAVASEDARNGEAPATRPRPMLPASMLSVQA